MGNPCGGGCVFDEGQSSAPCAGSWWSLRIHDRAWASLLGSLRRRSTLSSSRKGLGRGPRAWREPWKVSAGRFGEGGSWAGTCPPGAGVSSVLCPEKRKEASWANSPPAVCHIILQSWAHPVFLILITERLVFSTKSCGGFLGFLSLYPQPSLTQTQFSRYFFQKMSVTSLPALGSTANCISEGSWWLSAKPRAKGLLL